ncbi:hypothetical protein RJ55_00612 [Drechmeria coniospora]|nr:hypothetical protein RJ55_00612 [Drechmeria coniospora]
MPWQPLPRIAFAVATFPFAAEGPADLPLEIGDELYIIEETPDGGWLRGYLVAPPSLLAGLTSVKGQTLEARVFSGIFPRSCVEVREMLGESDERDGQQVVDDEHRGRNGTQTESEADEPPSSTAAARPSSDAAKSSLVDPTVPTARKLSAASFTVRRRPLSELPNGTLGHVSAPAERDVDAPRPAAPVPMLKIGDETPTSASEPLIDEIASCLREWHSTNLHELLLSRRYAELDKLSQLITSLNLHRQKFLHNVLTANEYHRLRERTVWDLVKVNKLCGGEVIVRDPAARGRVLTADDSVVEVTSLQSHMSLLEEPSQPVAELSSLYHLLLEVKGFAASSAEEMSLSIHLVSKPPHGNMSNLFESFSVDVPSGGTMGNLTQSEPARTLFAELSAQDIGDAPSADSDLYLVVKVLATQKIPSLAPQSHSGTATDHVDSSRGHPRSAPTTANKASRRSLMWSGKNGRTALSRASGVPKLNGLPERADDSSRDGATPSNAGHPPPGTSDSRAAAAADGPLTTMRIVGVGVLKLNSIAKQTDEVEQVISIWSPTPRLTADEEDGEEWDPLIREVLGKSTGCFEKSRRGERLQLSLRMFNHPNADALINATPTLLSAVSKTSRIGFSGAPTQPRSDIYLTVNTAALARQNLLSRFGGSATSMPPGLQGQNLQVTLEVRGPDGQRFDNCIYAASNREPVSVFRSAAVERGEAWNQTLRLSLSPTDVPTAHVVLFLSDMPNPPFAVAHLPLWDQEAFTRDGRHGLLLYKLDENTSTAHAGPSGRGGYLSLPWAPRGRDQHSADVTGPLAVLLVDSFLCSTRFSQDRVILGILHWKNMSHESLTSVLRRLIFVPEIEVVKLLSDVLDGLFGMLVEHSENDEFEDLVLTALVKVLGIVHDRRFNLGPLVDHYAEGKFNYPFAAASLVRAFTRLLQDPTEPETARKLRTTFKVVRHILKFIKHARGQMKAKEAVIGIKSSPQGFTRQLRTIFKALDAMMCNPAPVLVGSQTLAVQHFHTWLPELTGLLTTEEIVHIAIDFMDSCTNVKGKLILYKLILIINYSKLDLFAHPDQNAALCANTVRWISPHWGHVEQVDDQWRDQVRLCCSIIASQVPHLGPEIPDHVPSIIDSYMAILSSPQKRRARLSLLFPTSYPFPSSSVKERHSLDEALVELSAILSAISSTPAGLQLELADGNLAILLEKLLELHMSILTGAAFPSGWLSVYIYHHKSTMRTLQYLAGIMLESFLPDPDDAESFNTELWKVFFNTLLKLVGSPSLALETFPEQKRRAVWKIAGDVREDGAELLRRTWEAIGWETAPDELARYGLPKLGGYQVQYVPALVGPIAELCLSVHEGLRKMAVEVLQTMIVSEWTLSEDLTVIQTEMIECLDQFFKTKPLTESILQKLFIGELLQRFTLLSEIPDDPLYAAIRELVATLDEFLDLLVAVHGGDGGNEASNIINRLRLMEFLRDMQKEEIFVRYVHHLASFQAESGNQAEAGLALRLHADLYEWDPTQQTPALVEPEFPAQTMFERKEKIYFDMVKHFEEAESWSNALTAYKELQVQYETNVFDFAKLARTERAIATIYETISKSDKLVPRYFKVVYKGLGFPSGMRDKEFIYEGSLVERASAFTDRMQEQYPSAQIVTNGDVEEVEGQFLIISAVTPHRDLTHQTFQRTRVPPGVRDFLLSSHPQSFTFTTMRNTSGSDVEEHHAEKVVLTTAEPFPTLLRRSEIVDSYKVRLSAHETALERIIRKTQEMTALERRLADGDESNAQQLLDAVSASVSLSSKNSVAHYRKLLPRFEGRDDENYEAEAELGPMDVAIKMALVDHALTIKRCLALFSRRASDIASQKHVELTGHFERRYETEIAMFAPSTPAPPASSTPSTAFRRSLSSLGHSPQWPNIASPLIGIKAEEASIGQRVSLRQRGTRLSFLAGRRQEPEQTPEPVGVNSGTDMASAIRRSLSKGARRRQSLFMSKSMDGDFGRNEDAGMGRRNSSASKQSLDRGSTKDDKSLDSEGPGLVKRGGSVRKRLSMLKLGKKTSKVSGVMRSVDEE